ncbi:BofC C-terminal domain-containing protein [Cohnella massiliensis]|uniref:BofC C-terminal domain-containing protein n=1 Tax=Cohnella massiliensis TaxID=1816691 RepID=UPI0009BAC902|nr:BofC C-terminal domain-containing protein [Cohnella massiliensis]
MFGIRLKNLKKRLKRQRRPIWSLGMWAGAVLAATLAGAYLSYQYVSGWTAIAPGHGGDLPAWSDNSPSLYEDETTPRGQTMAVLAKREGEVEIVLHRVYLCGEESRKLGRHTTLETIELLKAHREWSASFDQSGRVVMEESVDDLSPACRKTATIGMDEDGNLSLYDGPPRKENAIRTFFQLDVGSLESSLSKERLKELAQGIRVTDRDEFNSVLSTFSDFARQKTADVMTPVNGTEH